MAATSARRNLIMDVRQESLAHVGSRHAGIQRTKRVTLSEFQLFLQHFFIFSPSYVRIYNL
jgi:hypothetical protein